MPEVFQILQPLELMLDTITNLFKTGLAEPLIKVQ
jgi:hypothetical protein